MILHSLHDQLATPWRVIKGMGHDVGGRTILSLCGRLNDEIGVLAGVPVASEFLYLAGGCIHTVGHRGSVLMRAQSGFLLLVVIWVAACAHAPPKESHPTAASAPVTPTAPAVTPTVSPPPGSFVPVPQAETPPVEQQSPSPVPAPRAPSKPAKPAAGTTKPPSAPVAAAPTPAAKPPQPQLDFKAMEQRLRDTSAVGVFTKLSIKNQVDDLLKAFRGYHAGKVPPTLDELHQRFDGLLLKVVTLVQDNDATLASSISASRGAIWERLSNKESFESI